jgi:hypothetical protein
MVSNEGLGFEVVISAKRIGVIPAQPIRYSKVKSLWPCSAKPRKRHLSADYSSNLESG